VVGLVFSIRRESSDDEFVPYDWNEDVTLYGVCSPMIADYYNDYLSASTRFRLKLLEDKKQATSGADLLARVQILRSVLRTLDYDNSLPIDAKLGKPDLVVTYEDGSTCAIELVLATRKMVS